MNKEIIHIGLDVHAENIAVAVAAKGGEVRSHGSISSDLHSVDKLLARLRKAHPGAQLRFCYEAGPTGFVLARHFMRKGLECLVAAPSLIPTKSGDRIKTDRRDAIKLARLFRAGELTGVNIPDGIRGVVDVGFYNEAVGFSIEFFGSVFFNDRQAVLDHECVDFSQQSFIKPTHIVADGAVVECLWGVGSGAKHGHSHELADEVVIRSHVAEAVVITVESQADSA